MSILPQLERDLLAAADRRHSSAALSAAEPSLSARSPRRRARRLWLALPAFALLLVGATIALAATGVILAGSPVRPNGPLNPVVGEGVPARGGSRLLAMRVPDPAGGLAWGMRIVRTTRGQVCLQIGRVQDGELGQLGIDGAFHDDGRFHPLPADVLPADTISGQNQNASCHLAGQTFTGEVVGLDRNATDIEKAPRSPRQNRRDIFYGLLGAHALSVTSRTGGAQRSNAVLPGVGAYLIVQPTRAHERVATSGGSAGVDKPYDYRPNPGGALVAITYRFDGKVCEDSVTLKPQNPCPRPQVTPGEPGPAPARDLHEPVHVRLQLRGHLIVGAELWFTAPFAVTSAREDYTIAMPSPCHAGTVVTSVGRNVARGSAVHVRLPYPFANACGPTVPVQVLYTGGIRVGFATLSIPPGTRPAPVPTPPVP